MHAHAFGLKLKESWRRLQRACGSSGCIAPYRWHPVQGVFYTLLNHIEPPSTNRLWRITNNLLYFRFVRDWCTQSDLHQRLKITALGGMTNVLRQNPMATGMFLCVLREKIYPVQVLWIQCDNPVKEQSESLTVIYLIRISYSFQATKLNSLKEALIRLNELLCLYVLIWFVCVVSWWYF